MRHRARVTTVVVLCAWLGLGAAYATATEPTDTDTSTATTLDEDGEPVAETTEDPDELVEAVDDTVEEAEEAVADAADSLDDTAQDPQQGVDDATSDDPTDESTEPPSEASKDDPGAQDGGGEDDPSGQDDERAQDDDAEGDTDDDGSEGSRRPRPHPDPPEFVFGEWRPGGGGTLEALRLGSSVALGSPISAGPRSTAELFARADLALVAPSVLQGLLAPFPVFGPASYQADFGAPRAVPTPHAHQGTDIFAQRGTPVIAAVDGIISHVRHDSAVGGNSLRLTAHDGSFFYYAHLDRFADDLRDGRRVAPGQVLGFVGDTGNAVGTPPHLHFEIHPDGGAAVDPVPYLDRWLADARTAIDRHLDSQQAAAPLVAPPAAPAPEAPTVAAAPTAPDEPPPVLAAPARNEMEAMLEARAQHERVALGAFVSSLLVLAIALRLRRPAALARMISRPQAATDPGRAAAVRPPTDGGGSS